MTMLGHHTGVCCVYYKGPSPNPMWVSQLVAFAKNKMTNFF